MRALRSALAVIAVAAAPGCIRNDTGAVLLHLEARTDVSLAPATYSSSTAAAAFTGDGLVHLTATSNQGVLALVLDGPLITGATIALPPDEERVTFSVGDAGWGNRGGTLLVLDEDPAIVTFDGVPMEPRAGAAVGAFVFTGGGTFR